MEIRFNKPSLRYKSGQWLFLQVPEISQFQWFVYHSLARNTSIDTEHPCIFRHPFTISSAPADPYISVHIRQAGDFTSALGNRLGCTSALAEQLTREARMGVEKMAEEKFAYGTGKFYDVTKTIGTLPKLRIDGPFGAPAEDVFNSEVAVLIGTGIGVTPWASVLKEIR